MSNPDNSNHIRGYQIHEELGRGGIGIVYRAYQKVIERDVAIKVIRPKYANEPDFIRRFQTEAQMVARLEHPHIIPLYDYWRDPQGAYLVMRWIREGSLRDVLERNKTWSLSETAELISQISSALTIAHQNNVIHRDIKPENILLDGINNAYLTDFGIAIDLQNTELFEENISYGSPQYSAPEQFSHKIVTQQTDVYSMGILLFELLTGTVPFSGANTGELLRQQHTAPLPSVRQFVPDLPARLDEIIWRATSKQWDKRYQTVAEFAREFQQAAKYIKSAATITTRQHTTTDTIQLDTNRDDAPPAETMQFDTRPLDDQQGTKQINVIRPAAPPTRNPYKGLQPFDEADASDFFGRDDEINKLIARLKSIHANNSNRLLALVGASGSGKSSLVRAGVIPALHNGAVYGSEQWFITTMTPSRTPITELQLALLRVATNEVDELEQIIAGKEGLANAVEQLLPPSATLLLFIDQFEELFTLTTDETTRTHFLDILQHAVNSKVHKIYVILTLRADFYDRPLVYPFFAEMLHRSTELILPLLPTQLEDVITEPAYRANLIIEPDLVTLMVSDLEAKSNSLPLLQYTLTQLYERREDDTLTQAAYEALGGVAGALAKRAQELYDELSEAEQDITRQLFLRLVRLNEQAKPTRQRVTYDEIISLFKEERTQAEKVLETFSQYRLLTRDRDPQTRLPTVEVAHETLLTTWEKLAAWIQESQDALRIQQRLAVAVTEWQNTQHDPSYLAAGTRLAEFEELQSNTTLNLTQTENQYLQQSTKLRQQIRRRNQLAVSALIVITILSVVFGALAYVQQQAAVRQSNRADLEASRARSGELAAIAQTNRQQTDLSLLLSVEAFNQANTFEARNSLLTAIQQNPFITRYIHAHEGGARGIAYAPNGEFFVSAGADATLRRWDAETGQMIGQPLEAHTANVNAVAISPDSNLIASGSSDGTVLLWQTSDATPLEHNTAIWSIAFSPDGTLLAVGDEIGRLHLWDINNLERVPIPIEAHQGTIFTAQFNADGTQILTGGEDNTLRQWDAESGERLGELIGHTDWILKARFSPDGTFIASTGADRTVRLWNTESSDPIGQFSTGHGNWVRGLAFNSTGNFLVTASYDGTARIFSVASGQAAIPPITGHTDALWDVAFAPDQLQIVTAARDGNLIVYDLTRPQAILDNRTSVNNDLLTLAVDETNHRIAAAGGAAAAPTTAGQIQLIDTTTNEVISVLEDHQGTVLDLDLSPDGALLASSSLDETVNIWNVISGELLATLADENDGVMVDTAFSPDGSTLYTTEEGNRILIWDIENAALSDAIQLPNEANTLSVNRDGSQIAAGHRNGDVSLWNLGDQSNVLTLTGHTDVVTDVTFTPDNRFLISTSRDRTTHLWDISTGEAIGTPLTEHQDWVMSVSVNADGTMFATTGRDGTVILWDAETRQPLGLPLQAHNGMVADSTFIGGGAQLITVGDDSNILTWQTDVSRWQQTACNIANRQLTPDEWERFFDTPYEETCPFNMPR